MSCEILLSSRESEVSVFDKEGWEFKVERGFSHEVRESCSLDSNVFDLSNSSLNFHGGLVLVGGVVKKERALWSESTSAAWMIFIFDLGVSISGLTKR